MPLIKLSKQESRKLSLFFICLFFAVAAWLFFALSNSYSYQTKTVVHYINIPGNKAFHPLQSDTVILQIQSTGWQLLFSRLRIKPQSVDVNLKGLSKTNYINFKDQLNDINSQFDSNQKITAVQPNILFFDFSAVTVKKIPIKFIYDIKFAGQYNISGKVRITPEYVTITGPSEDLSKFNIWETANLKLNRVTSTITTKISLKNPPKTNITIYPAEADVEVPVDEFTEKIIEVPVKVLNLNGTGLQTVKLLPDKVKITLMTALSNYSKIDKELFEITADMNDWKNKKCTQLPLKIIRFPDYCQLVKIEPQAIDFILSN